MFGGSHSHSGGSGGSHSHGSGDSGTPGGGCIALGLGIPFAIVIVILIIHTIVSNVERNHDSILNRTDRLIISANLTVGCRAVEERHGRLLVGPSCSQAAKSAALVIEMKGVPSGVRFLSSGSRGQYYAHCIPDGAGGGGNLITKPTVQGTGFFGTMNIALPGNACVISPGPYTTSVEIGIVRWGVGNTQYDVRSVTVQIDPSWYRLDNSFFSP
jgi:hypothetical protein